jgi:hypothetical protein
VAYYIRQLADEYIGLQRRLTTNAWPIITDEYNDFIFFTSACFGCLPDQEPQKQAKYTGNRYMHHNIAHIHKIHNIVYDKFKTSSQQAKQLLYDIASLSPDPPVGLKRPLTKLYPCPPPCDPEPP